MTAELIDRTPVRVFAELISNTARLTVTSSPEDAAVRIDGIMVGTTPLTVEEVTAGESDIKVSKRGYTPYQKRMVFEATKPYKINAELEALQRVEDVGPIVADHIRHFFDQSENRVIVERLLQQGVNWPQGDAGQQQAQTLVGNAHYH